MGIFGVEQIAHNPLKTIENPRSIGEHIKKRRLELHLFQADVANILGVCEDSITGWENGRSEPQIRYYPKLIEFLGYNPIPENSETLGGRIKKYRLKHGLSLKHFAKLFGADEKSIVSWEKNETIPRKSILDKIKELI